MTADAFRVIEAAAWSDRLGCGPLFPLKRIAAEDLGGNGDLAARVLAGPRRAGLGPHGYDGLAERLADA